MSFFALKANAQTISDENFDADNQTIFAVSGFVNVTSAARNQSSAFDKKFLPDNKTTNYYSRNSALENNSQIYLKVAQMAQNQVKYGATLKLESEISTDQKNGVLNIDEGFLYAQSDYGKLEFGNNKPANQKMKVGPASFARGNGGINGNYLKYINLPMLANSASCPSGALDSACANTKLSRFILLPQSLIGHGGYAQGFYGHNLSDYNSFNKTRITTFRDGSFNGLEDATKISYYTPRLNGLQIGLTYTPTTYNRIFSSTVLANNAIRVSDVISVGANYSGNFNNLGYALSFTSENGKFKKSSNLNDVNRNNLSSYDVAFTAAYFGFSVGASYGSWGDSLQPKSGIYSCDYNSNLALFEQNCSASSKKFKGANYNSFGIAYKIGPVGLSVTNLRSNFQKNIYQATSLDIDYKLAKGLMPYVEFTKFEFKSNQIKSSDVNIAQIKDNKGLVALVGILFSF